MADSHYGGDDNIAAAEELGVEVVAPAMGAKKKDAKKKEKKFGLEYFEFSEDGEALSCPAGHAPSQNNPNLKKGRHSVGFDSEKCRACPCADDCPAEPGKKHRYLRYNDKAARLARRRAFERTPEFKGRYRMRAGVEATMSALDRLTNIKRLRVRGLPAVRFRATLKATGVNIFRAAAVRSVRKAAKPAPFGKFSSILLPVYVFKERFFRFWQRVRKLLTPDQINSQLETQMAS